MDERRVRYAAKRGGWIAFGAFAIAYGLAMLRPTRPPDWTTLLVVPLVLGLGYAVLVHLGIRPVDGGPG